MKKKRATESTLNELHSIIAKELIKRINSGDATTQDLNAAIKFLKDNNIEAEFEKGGAMDTLKNIALPEFEDELG
jgi:hypothetical protein